MQINEIFGWGGKKDPQGDLIQKIIAEINEQRRYLRYAYTAAGHRDKHDYIAMVTGDFRKLYARAQKGEDVTQELNSLYKELKKARGFW